MKTACKPATHELLGYALSVHPFFRRFVHQLFVTLTADSSEKISMSFHRSEQNKPQGAWEYLALWGDQSPKSAQPPAPNSTLAALCHEHRHPTRNPKPRNKINPLLFAKISTGDPSGRSQGQPLNCQAGPWTNTATTRSLEHTEGWTWAQPATFQSPAVLNRHGCFFYRTGQHI